MGANTTTSSANGDISLLALTGNVTLMTVHAGSANLAITATLGSLIDGNAGAPNLSASGLLLKAGTAIGAADDALETSVGTLSASAGGGGIYLSESNGVTVDTVGVSVQRVDETASVAAAGASQADLTTSGVAGNIVLVAQGTITLNDGTPGDVGMANTAVSANGAGSILMDAQGAGSSLVLKANVVSATGQLSLHAAAQLEVGQGTTAATVSTAGAGTVNLEATSGAILMLGTSTVVATASTARLGAGTGVALGNVSAANVSIRAGSGSITNAPGSTKNVSATNLRLQAAGAIGEGARHLSTAVSNVSALS
jgi:hypothetical protein